MARTALQPRQTASTRLARACAVALVALPPLAASSCIEAGYPLAPGGTVDVRLAKSPPLFAADSVDGDGKPVLPRQDPFGTRVTLSITEANAPAYGGFVTVRVEPREALTLSSVMLATDASPTCVERDGSFRCTARKDGTADFDVSSESTWSGSANLIVSWADRTEEKPIEILPAGLPSTATNFDMVVTGLNDSPTGRHLLATYLALQCSIDLDVSDLDPSWRPGAIRAREARVTATGPLSDADVVKNAPVTIKSLSSEAALSTKIDCEVRQPELKVLLGPTAEYPELSPGESPPFFLCFSDIGGPASFAVTSGEKFIEPEANTIQVDAEPRLLRVRALQTTFEAGVPGDLFEVSAFDANLVGIPMPVDLKIDDDQVIALSKSTITLDGEPAPATAISGTPRAAGTVTLSVTPRLLTSPACKSEPVTVVEVP